MEEKQVTYAPENVIKEIDEMYVKVHERNMKPFGVVINVIEAIVEHPHWYETSSWVNTKERQIALIKHLLDIEKLEPEREVRYYVESVNPLYGGSAFVRSDEEFKFVPTYIRPTYEESLDHETAVKAQALFGGEIMEVK